MEKPKIISPVVYPMFPGEKPDIRLLAIDLDDTLLTGGLIITPRTKKAIQAACRQGVAVTLATGRMFTSALPYAQELGIGLPLITYQGALVRTPDGQTISHHPIDQRLCVELLSFLLPFGCHVNVYIEDQFYIEKTSPEAERYRARIRTAYHEVPSLLAMMAESAMGATKIALMADKERISEIMAAIRSHFQERVLAVPSKPTFLEINRPDTGKGVALAVMAEGMGIGRLQVMAIGDSPNDLDMIEYAGWGIVMANGEDAVKEKARWVTASNEEEGVAVAIEHLVLK